MPNNALTSFDFSSKKGGVWNKTSFIEFVIRHRTFDLVPKIYPYIINPIIVKCISLVFYKPSFGSIVVDQTSENVIIDTGVVNSTVKP